MAGIVLRDMLTKRSTLSTGRVLYTPGVLTSTPHHGYRIKSGKTTKGVAVRPSPQPSPTRRGSFPRRSPIGVGEDETEGVYRVSPVRRGRSFPGYCLRHKPCRLRPAPQGMEMRLAGCCTRRAYSPPQPLWVPDQVRQDESRLSGLGVTAQPAPLQRAPTRDAPTSDHYVAGFFLTNFPCRLPPAPPLMKMWPTGWGSYVSGMPTSRHHRGYRVSPVRRGVWRDDAGMAMLFSEETAGFELREWPKKRRT